MSSDQKLGNFSLAIMAIEMIFIGTPMKQKGNFKSYETSFLLEPIRHYR